MEVDELFDLLLPGDLGLGVPSFRQCDDSDNISGFLCTVPDYFAEEIKYVDDSGLSPDKLLKVLKENEVDLRPVINNLLSFYFSRPAVVKPLTGRVTPLAISGMATF